MNERPSRQLVQPFAPGLEVLGVGAVDREAEVVSSGRPDDALPDDGVAWLQTTHGRPGLDDLAAPLVPGDDRIRDGDDVPALVELEVGMADADGVGLDEHLVGADLRMADLGHDRLMRGLEDQCLHRLSSVGR